MGPLNVRQAVLCIGALRKLLNFDGVLAARDAGTLDPATGKIAIPLDVLKAIVKAHPKRKPPQS